MTKYQKYGYTRIKEDIEDLAFHNFTVIIEREENNIIIIDNNIVLEGDFGAEDTEDLIKQVKNLQNKKDN